MRNILFSIGQIIGTSIMLFIFYRKATLQLGKESFGTWALVMGISSLANVGNLGLAGGLVKYTAEFYILKKFNDIRDSLNFSVLFVALFFFIICAIIYFFKVPIINFVINKPNARLVANSIIPYSLISLFLNGISLLFFSVIDGINKGFIKNIFNFLSTLIFVSFALILIDNYSINGIVYAQIFQSLFFLISSILSVILSIPGYTIFKFKWKKDLFKKIFTYSINLQGLGLITLLYEPLVKGILSKYSGLTAVSYYEIANKVIQQSKAFINLSVVNLIPKISALQATKDEYTSKKMYYFASELGTFVSILIFSGLVGFTPIFSKFSFGTLETDFYFIFIVLIIANLINSLSIPAFYFASAEGYLKILIFGNVIILATLVISTAILKLIVINSMILAWGLALSLGSIYFIQAYQKIKNLNNHWLLNRKNLILFLFSSIISSILFILSIRDSNIILVISVYIIFVISISYFFVFKLKKYPLLNNLIDNLGLKHW